MHAYIHNAYLLFAYAHMHFQEERTDEIHKPRGRAAVIDFSTYIYIMYVSVYIGR